MGSQIELWEVEDAIVERLKEIDAFNGAVKAASSLEADYEHLIQHPPAALVQCLGTSPTGITAIGTNNTRHDVAFGVLIAALDLRSTGGGDDARADKGLHRLLALSRDKLHGYKIDGLEFALELGPQVPAASDPDTLMRSWQQEYRSRIWIYHNPDA